MDDGIYCPCGWSCHQREDGSDSPCSFDCIGHDPLILRADRDRLAGLVEIERTANKVTENHNHFDCAAAMAQKDIEIARLADLRDELQASLRVQAEDHAHRLADLLAEMPRDGDNP